MGLSNISCPCHRDAPEETTRTDGSKKYALSLPKGLFSKAAAISGLRSSLRRSRLDARSVLSVRERERREERQVCEPEGVKMATMPTRSRFGRYGTTGLSAIALAKADGFFQHSYTVTTRGVEK